MAEKKHEPIYAREFLSPLKDAWLRTELREGLTRCAAIANVMTSTPRPTNKAQTIWDSVWINNKLHDREPQAVVDALEKRWSNFFDDFPARRSVTDKVKREFVGEWARAHINYGLRQFGKPALRSKPAELVAIE